MLFSAAGSAVMSPPMDIDEGSPEKLTDASVTIQPHNLQTHHASAPPLPSESLPQNSSSELDSPSSTPSVHDAEDEDYHLGSDHDAEGSPDDDAPQDRLSPLHSNADSAGSSSETSGARKRKRESDIDDYIQQDPELYGIRRSGRTRAMPKQPKLSDASDEDSDDIDIRPAGARRKAKQARRSKKSTPAPRSSLSEDSGVEDEFGSKKDKARRRRRNRMRVADHPLAPAERASSRNAAQKVTNYVDDDGLSDEFMESDQGDIEYEYYSGPSIDLVLLHRRKIKDDDSEPRPNKYEYLIKWVDQARYHATWKDMSDLKDCAGFKKLSNYFDRTIRARYNIMHDPEVSPEDKENVRLDAITEEQKLESNYIIHRVVAERDNDGHTEYLIKWNDTEYADCTWEDEELVEKLARDQLTWFEERRDRPDIISRTTQGYKRPKHSEFLKSQPPYIKHGVMRDFQLIGLSRMIIGWSRHINMMLSDEMGLGKTIQTVALMSWLKNNCGVHGPFIVVAPKSVLPAWEDALTNWTPDLNWVTYNGNEKSRAVIQEWELFANPRDPSRVRFNVLLTSYEMYSRGKDTLKLVKWQFLAVDEAHRLKSRKNTIYSELQQLDTASRLLITGTPFQNDFEELVALLCFLQPDEHFESRYDFKTDDVSAQAKQIEDLQTELRKHLVRRTKEEVAGDLPPKSEQILRVELSDMQLEYYKNILTRNYDALSRASNGQKIGLNNMVIELKKASVHPYLFPGVEDHYLPADASREDALRGLIINSGKMMLLDHLLNKLRKEGHRVLIFSGFVAMLNILERHMQLRDHKFQRLDGQTPGPARTTAMNHFNAADSEDFAFLLSTRAGGLGINLYTADTVILFDSDWNPQADLQAMARAHRIGQKKPVTIYRFVSKGTVEEDILERARNKLLLEYVTFQRGFSSAQRKDFKEKMEAEGASSEKAESADEISRILKTRSKKMFEQVSNQKQLEELNIDAVLEGAEEHKTQQMESIGAMGDDEFLKQFAYEDVTMNKDDWDSIIPKADRDRLAEQDRKKADTELARRINEESAPRTSKSSKDASTNGKRERLAKKKPGELVETDLDDSSDGKNKRDDDSDEDADVDPDQELTNKQLRRLVETYKALGYIEDRPEHFMQRAKLEKKNPDLVKAALQEVLDLAEDNMKKTDKDDPSRSGAAERHGSKKNQKAVVFAHKGASRLNAEVLLRRPYMMRTMRQFLEGVTDVPNFRIPEAIKDSQYTVEWGPREDAMLTIGVARHGHGQWEDIMNDTELGMQGKFFLTENINNNKNKRNQDGSKSRTPAGPHLVRRADYLLDVVVNIVTKGADKDAAEAVANHHRNNKRDIAGDPDTVKRQKRRERDSRLKVKKEQEKQHLPHRASASPSVDRHRHRGRDSERPYLNGFDSSATRAGTGSASPRQRARTDSKAFKNRLSNGERPRSPLITHKDLVDRTDGHKVHKEHHQSQPQKRRSDRMDDHDEHDSERPIKARISQGSNQPIHRERASSKAHRGPDDGKVYVQEAAKEVAGSGFDEQLKPLVGQFDKLKQEYTRLRQSSDDLEKKRASVPMQTWIQHLIKFIDGHGSESHGDFEAKCWDHIGKHYWFGTGVDGSKLFAMSKKVREKMELASKAAAVANGAHTDAVAS